MRDERIVRLRNLLTSHLMHGEVGDGQYRVWPDDDDGGEERIARCLLQALPHLDTLELRNVIMDDLTIIAAAVDPPSFPRLRAFDVNLYTESKPSLVDVSKLCREFYDNWRRKVAPRLERVRVLMDDFNWVQEIAHIQNDSYPQQTSLMPVLKQAKA